VGRLQLAGLVFVVAVALAACGGHGEKATSSPTATRGSASPGDTSGTRGCGQGCADAGPPASASPPPAGTSPAIAPAPGCGSYCIGAGPSGGPNPDECPSTHGACKRCPSAGCVGLRSDTGSVHDGQAQFVVRCMLSKPCTGTFLLFRPGEEASQTASTLPPRERLAQSDLRIAANSEATAHVGLTPRGQRLLNATPSLPAEAYIALDPYGPVLGPPSGGLPVQRVTLTH
jgi:hypothetical protein